MAKQLNPNFQLPVGLLMTMFIPEVTNVEEALASLEAERAQQHPSYAMVQLIQAYERLAEEARVEDSPDQAQMFAQLAQQIRKQLSGQPTTDDRLGETEQLPSPLESRLGE